MTLHGNVMFLSLRPNHQILSLVSTQPTNYMPLVPYEEEAL